MKKLLLAVLLHISVPPLNAQLVSFEQYFFKPCQYQELTIMEKDIKKQKESVHHYYKILNSGYTWVGQFPNPDCFDSLYFNKNSGKIERTSSCMIFTDFTGCDVAVFKYDSLQRISTIDEMREDKVYERRSFMYDGVFYLSSEREVLINGLREKINVISRKDSVFNIEFYDLDKERTNGKRVYNKKGQLLKEEWYDRNKKVITTYRFKYNLKGQLSEIRKSGIEGDVSWAMGPKIWVYDSFYHSLMMNGSRCTIKYREDGLPDKMEFYNNDKLNLHRSFIYK
jgi:hypothetical protein